MSDEVLDELDESYDEMCRTVDSMIEEDVELQSYLETTVHLHVIEDIVGYLVVKY